MSDEIPLAAEYVLRLLDGEELIEARRRVAEEAAFADEVAWWEERLAPLFDEIGAKTPSAELWPRIIMPVVIGALSLGAWEWAVRANGIPPYVLPSPSVIWATLLRDWPSLSVSLWVTLQITFAALAVAAAAGLAGAFADSLLGATGQAMYRCQVCGSETERAAHCGAAARRERGLAALTNDRVNLLSSLFAGLLAYALFCFAQARYRKV